MENVQNIVAQRQLELQDKRRYFLLAAVGTAVGFIVTQISPETTGDYFWVLAVGLVLLALSFLAGLWGISLTNQLLQTNYNYLEFAVQGMQRRIPISQSKEIADEASFTPLAKKLNLSTFLQISCLGIGALMVPIWKTLTCSQCVSSLWKSIGIE